MNKKKLLRKASMLFFVLSVSFSVSIAQTGYKEKENIEYVSFEKIQETLNELKFLRATLPARVDHSQSKYMCAPVNQDGESCGSVSRITYMFAYEINNFRKLDGKNSANYYPSHFTWMLTDQNSDKENMAIFNGIPTSNVYGGRLYNKIYNPGSLSWPSAYKEYGWMTGYDKWRSAMDNRLEKTGNVKLTSDEAMEYVKWWIYNHQGDDDFQEGGVVGAGAASFGWTERVIPSGSYEGGKSIITAYGSAIDHGVMLSGYDDNVEFDLDGNGTIENDEKGAFILMNSWGITWGNKGCIYLPYKLARTYGGGLGIELYYIRKNYKPLDVFRIKMSYTQRSNIKISIGVSANKNATQPDKTIVAEHFNNAGFEPIPLLGRYNNVINNNPMEFGLDLTDLTSIGFDLRNDYRYFLVLEIKSGSTGTGEVEELEVIRHEQGVGTVIGRMNAPMEISGGNKKIYIPIDVPGSSDITPTYLYVPQKRLSVASFSSQEASGEGNANGRAIHALDDNSSTYWHSRWSSSPQPLPHYIVFEIDSTYTLNGFEYLPRQNSANGRIGEYDVYILQSRNDNNGVLISSGTFDNDGSVKRAFFEPVQGKFVKIVNKKSAGGDPNTCMAEFNLFYSAETAGNTSLEEPEETTTMSVHQYRSTLFISGVTGNAVFELFNLQGQKVKSLSANVTGSSVTQLDIANLDSGIYILKSFTDKQTKSVKVFIK